MGAFDDLIPASGGGGAFDDLVPQKREESGGAKALRLADATYKAIGSGLIKGSADLASGIGNASIDPSSFAMSTILGGVAAADRGVTAVGNWVSPGSATPSEGIQQTAQDAAAFAAAEREKAIQQARMRQGNDFKNDLVKMGVQVRDAGRTVSGAMQDFDQNNNPTLTEQSKAINDATGFVDTTKAMFNNPVGTINQLSNSAPGMAAGLGLSRAASMARMAGLEAGAGATAIEAAKVKAISSASTAGAVSEAAQAAIQDRESVYQQVAGTPFDQLAEKSPRFNEIVAKVGDQARARQILANELADQVTLGAGVVTGLGTIGVNKLFGGDTTAKIVSGLEKTTAKTAAKDVLQEGVEETLQGVPEDLVQHGALSQADKDKKLDLGGSAAQNFWAGALMASHGAGGSYIKDKIADYKDGKAATPPADPLDPNPSSATPNTPPPSAPAGAAATPEVSAAEKALITPVELTSLDRVNSIGTELEGLQARQQELAPGGAYGPMFDQERTEVATKIAELSQERADLSKDWAKPVFGNATTVTLPSGAVVAAHWAVIDAGEALPSHDINLKSNDSYDKSLQPRDRGERHGYELQIAGIVQRYNPAMLDESPLAGMGAPTMRMDGSVIDGNGREIATQRVYRANGQKAAELRAYVSANSDRKGIPPEAFLHKANPQFVRVIDHIPGFNYGEFAKQANESVMAPMSPSETAKSDANRIDTMEDLKADDNGDFSNAASQPFIRRFMARLPATEQAGMIDASGALSTTGYARVRNAVLAKAYGDSPVLARMTESMDDNLRNVSKALLLAAPKVAQMREAVGAGNRFDADITPDLMGAVEELSRLKEKGTSVEDALAQAGMFGDDQPQEVKDLLRFLSENLRRPRKIADFITAYMEALDAAGDPNQGSLLGDVQAPTKGELLTAAKRSQDAAGPTNTTTATDTQRADSAKNPQDGVAPQGRPENAQNDQGGTGRDGSAQGSDTRLSRQRNSAPVGEASEWVNFPKDSGTIGIPRADMPQIKGEHRGALIQFLQARGIEHKTKEIPAADLKPTQAEFSTKKAARWSEVRDGVDRSVLVSKDGHILDGHHQWVAALAANEPVKAIVLNAPIRELMANVFQFPSVKQSGDSASASEADGRAKPREDFKQAMAELADLVADKLGTRVMMMPSGDPKIMAVLIKLFDSAIRVVGTDLKAATKWVKAQLKGMPETKPYWNKITDKDYSAAAMAALEQQATAHVDDLFSAAEKSQADLFSNEPAAPKVAMIDGRAYDYTFKTGDNFNPPSVSDFLPDKEVKLADGLVAKYYSNKPEVKLAADILARGEKLIQPFIDKANLVKSEYDQKIIDIATRTKAIGQLLAPIKSTKRAVEKMHDDAIEKNREMRADDVKDLLRATIVVSRYEDAQAVINEIGKEFKILRTKNRTETDFIQAKAEGRKGTGGYSDVLVNVQMLDGTVAEIQVNIPEMLAAKEGPDKQGQGHKLFEAAREQKTTNPALYAEIYEAMEGFYDATFLAAQSRALDAAAKNPLGSSVNPNARDGKSLMPGQGINESPSSDSLNQEPSGKQTKSSPSESPENLQPGGKTSGTFISNSNTDSVAKKTENGYSQSNLFGESNGNDTDGGTGSQGKGAGAVSAAGRKRGTQGPREGSSGADQRGDGTPGAGGPSQESLGQTGTDGTGGKTENVGRTQSRARDGGPAGVPAGRDIPAKSGLNYEFGPDDLTYEGSWVKKAAQNVDAVELLVKLEAEGRQATKDEQTVLAKFVGWGSSEVANAIFGTAGDKNESKIKAFNLAKAAIENSASISYSNPNYWTIKAVLDQVGRARVPYRSDIDSAFISPKNFGLESSDIKYGDLRARLKAVMSKDEWAEASRSTQYAHYTSRAIVTSMYKALDRMGFKGGAMLEPGAGIGVFPGLMPAAMAANTAYTGIEFDSITGRILKQLFPDERILVESFVDSKLPKNFYDVAVGNPPFSGTQILGDPEYQKHAFNLHDYFFAKSIDRVKPGGLVVYVTSKGTMDKLGDKARQYLAGKADLVGAIRLPQTAFKQNAGTEVVTDVIFLRKKVPGETFAHAQAWLKTATVKTPDGPAIINEYFAAHPEMVLGTHALQGSMYKANEYTVLPLPGDIEEHFARAVEKLPADIYVTQRGTSAEAAKVREIDFNPKAQKEGNYYVSDAGVLMVREGGVGMRAEDVAAKDMELVKDFVPLRDALKQAHYDQLNNGEWEQSMVALQKAYAAFTKKHGQINQFTTKMVKTTVVDEETGEKFTDEEARRTHTLLSKIKNDPDYTLVMALENINDDTGVISPSAFLTERVLGKQATAQVSTPTDALLSVLNDVGHVDMAAIAQRLNVSEQDAISALGSSVYQDPEGEWVTADEYQSGNVKRKLEIARSVAKSDKAFERNVTALEAVQPEAKTPSQINASLGMNWIPGQVYADFLQEVTGVRARVEWNARTKQWIVEEKAGGATMQARADWGTDRRNATSLLEHALTGRKVRIDSRAGKDEAPKFDPAATEAANAKLVALQNEFQQWIWKDPERTNTLVREFNDKFNTTVPRSFDGTHLTLPGTSKRWSVFDHVKRGAWRIVARGNTYLAHAVGSGKTFQMVISAMEQKRLGLIKKPMMVVPNHMLQQFAREWQDLYPAARLMVADENNFHTDNRRRFVSRVALSDLDGVIITQSAFKLLDLDPEFKQRMIQEQLDFMRAALVEAGGNPDTPGKNGREPRIKQIEKQIENMEQKLEAAMSSVGKDKNARFDELGVDMLYVDEAHNYRKLDFTTNREVKGITPAGSGQAFDLFMKSRYLEEKTPGRSLVMASGTPVTNTVAELYTVQKFMDRQALIDRGMEDFDSWAAMFGREKTTLEPNAAGKYEPVTRFSKFVNVPELTQMFREYADVLNSDHLAALLGDKRPKVDGGSRKITITPKTDDYAEYQDVLSERVAQSKAWKPSPDQPNNPDPIIKIIGDGRLAAIDMRFIDPSLKNDPDSKLNRMIDDVIKSYKDTSSMEYTDKAGNPEPNKGASMMVFSDLGFGAGVAASRGFNARAWFEKRMRDSGVPMAQVAFMSDYKKSADKLKLFKDVNAGRMRILVGSSKNMGTGVNAQQRLKSLFHLDSPWYPADLEQREGRIIRQGNKNPLVQIYAYAAKGTYDENMWKMLASKQYFIDQALSGDANLREIEDLDSMSQYDLAAAMIADDPRILQLAGARADIEKMQRLYQAHEQQRMKFLEQSRNATSTIAYAEHQLVKATADAGLVQDLSGDKFTAKAGKKAYTVRSDWAQALIDRYKELAARVETQTQTIGQISGFNVAFKAENVAGQYLAQIMLETPEQLVLAWEGGVSPVGMSMRATNALAAMATLPYKLRDRIVEARALVDALGTRLQTPFPMAQMLAEKVREASDLEAQIAADSKAKDAAKAAESPAEGETKLSRGTGGGMDVSILAALATKIKKAMPNMPMVHVLESPAKAPKALRDYIEKQGAMADVEGAYHDGELYLFASGLSDALRAEHVLAEHEAAHFGLRSMLGDSLKTTMLMVYNNNTYIRQLATELQKRGKLSNAEATEEAIVDIPTSRLIKLQGWRKLVHGVHAWLGAYGFENMARKVGDWLNGSLDDQQRADLFVANLVTAARRHVAGKNQGKFDTQSGTMLASSMADDAMQQEKWLMTEARARGFKDIDQLAEQDYPLFEKLAKLWREKNPADEGILMSRGVSALRRWAGKSKVVDANGNPRVMYHGTTADISTFKEGAPIYVADTGAAASEYAKQFGYVENADAGNGGNVMPLYVKAENPFDYESPENVAWLVSALKASDKLKSVPIQEDEDYYPVFDSAQEALKAGDPYAYRSKVVQDAIAKRFDSFYSVARGVRNLAVFSPTQVKSAIGNNGAYDPANPDIRMSRPGTAAQRADQIIQTNASTAKPLDAVARMLTRVTGLERLTGAIYNRAGYLLDRFTPENVKAGLVSDYGVPESVIDQRAMMQGRQRVQLRQAGALIDKLSTLTRAESRVAYAWMNETEAGQADYFMQQLPPESVKILEDVRQMIDKLSQEAVRMGQLGADVYEKTKFAYLRRSYAKYTMDQTPGQKAARARAISVLGDQYKGRGLTEAATMKQIQNVAPEWWKRKLASGKADKGLKGEKFIRLERRASSGQGVNPLPGVAGNKAQGRLQEVHYFPAGEALPAKYADWDKAGTFEVRDTQGEKVVLWRDFTKDEREQMGEIDEARFAIAKTLQGMIHDVEVGRYLEWLAHNQALKEGQTIPGAVVDASDRYRDTFKPGEWVKVPDAKISGTSVAKYGKLAGRYVPGPVWNDLRQTMNGQFKPFGDTYGMILSAWKTAKTALSPAVHTNNIMSNFVMADWHDVTAGHTAKALRILLGAHDQGGKGVLGTIGNKAAGVIGSADRDAAREIVNRYLDSGGDIGSWATNEISKKQIEPLLDALEKELAATNGQSVQAQVGIFHALQHALQMRFPSAWDSLKGSTTGKVIGTEASTVIDLYQSEDEVFRLAAWLKAKEEGKTDMEAGKIARRSFMDYSINAPWVQALRNSALPFVSYTYRAVPMFMETAAKKPHKLLKLMAIAGALNAFGLMMAGGGGDDKERKLLPEEKAGRVWGLVPKMIRMPWNDPNGSPVYLDIRRFIPVGDIFDIGQGHSAIPLLPSLTPGGPLAILAELALNKTQFTGKPITLDTDTGLQRATKVLDYLYKAFMPNLLGVPGTYATTGVFDAANGKTDAFGRQQSVAQAMASSFGVKLGSYPADVLARNLRGAAQAQIMEIDRNISGLKRQRQMNGISASEFDSKVQVEQEKKAKVMKDLAEKMN
jgi:N12 class adenine-specific DNA methylase